MAKTERCRLETMRCYVPTLLMAVLMGHLVAWFIWSTAGRDLASLQPSDLITALLLWFIMSPVLIGVIRGVRRHRRHLSRPRGI